MTQLRYPDRSAGQVAPDVHCCRCLQGVAGRPAPAFDARHALIGIGVPRILFGAALTDRRAARHSPFARHTIVGQGQRVFRMVWSR